MKDYCNEHQHKEPCPVCLADRQTTPVRDRQAARAPAVIGDRDMWIMIRSGMLTISSAIKKAGATDPLLTSMGRAFEIMASAIELRWDLKRQKAN